MKKKSFSFIGGIILLVIIFIFTSFVVKKFKKPGSMTVLESQSMDMSAMTAPKGAFPVAVKAVSPEYIEEKVTYTGTAVPFNEQNAATKVSGWLTELLVYPGDKVSAGQVIARLTAKDLSSQAKEAQASAQGSKAQLKYWEEEIKRAEKLYKGGAISKDEYQKEKSDYLSAKAAFISAKAKKETAETFQAYTEIKSLINGVVTKRMMSEGSLVNAGDVIFQIAQIDPIRLQANVAQQDLGGIKTGSGIAVYDSKKQKIAETKVSAVFPAVDTVSRTAVVEAITGNSSFKFLPGQYVIMSFTKNSHANALTVPSSAVVETDNKPAVWIVLKKEAQGEKTLYTCSMHPEVISDKPGKCSKCGMDLVKKEGKGKKTAHMVYVTTGISDGEKTEIVNGLKIGDEVIYAGFQDLKEGDPVFPTSWGENEPKNLPPAENTHDMKNMPGMEMPGMNHN